MVYEAETYQHLRPKVESVYKFESTLACQCEQVSDCYNCFQMYYSCHVEVHVVMMAIKQIPESLTTIEFYT